MDKEERLSHSREYDRARRAWETAEHREVRLRQWRGKDSAPVTAEQREVHLRQCMQRDKESTSKFR